MELIKLEFRQILRPFLDLLESKRNNSNLESWIVSVRNVQLRIVAEPQQYLGKELPSPPTIHILIDEIFEEFIQENSVRQKEFMVRDDEPVVQ
jgi:hypothetical protein